jgi:hypothetical protein
MEQRPPSCAHKAPCMLVPSTSTFAPHHTEGAYRPLLPGTAWFQAESGHGGFVGYSSLPSSMLLMLSQLGITSPGHVARHWTREGHTGIRSPYPTVLY